MFGYDLVTIYFMINCSYAIISFFFLHSIVAEKLDKAYEKMTTQPMGKEKVDSFMTIFYVLCALIGTLWLIKDMLTLIFNHKDCIWLYRIYGEQKVKK